MSIVIRPMTLDDVEFGLAQQAREGWSTGRGMLAGLLEHDPDGGFVASSDGRPIGLITTSRFADTAWISNLIVAPGHRSRGVGRALMEHGLQRLDATGACTVRLDGDPPGIPLYRSLGFEDEGESLRFQWTPSPVPQASVGVARISHQNTSRGRRDAVPSGVFDSRGAEAYWTVRRAPRGEKTLLGKVHRRPQQEPGEVSGPVSLGAEDLDEIAELDAEAFGDRRDRLLRLQLARVEVALGLRLEGRLRGFVLGEATNRGLFVGPCAAVDPWVARMLLEAVMVAAGQRPVRLGILDRNSAGAALLTGLGFTPTAPSLRMRRGDQRGLGDPAHYFAIASGAVG